MQLEEPAEEPDHEHQVLLPVRQIGGAPLALVELGGELGDVLAERGDALAGGRLADEVGDQQAEERLALERGETDGIS